MKGDEDMGDGISLKQVSGGDATWLAGVHGNRAAKVANGGPAAPTGLRVSEQKTAPAGVTVPRPPFDADPPRGLGAGLPERSAPLNSALPKLNGIRNDIGRNCNGYNTLPGRTFFNGLACAALMIQMCNHINKTYRLQMACKVIGEISKLFAEAREIRSAAVTTRIMGIVAGSVGIAMGGVSAFASYKAYSKTSGAAQQAGCDNAAADLRSASMTANGKAPENLTASTKSLSEGQKNVFSDWQTKQNGKLLQGEQGAPNQQPPEAKAQPLTKEELASVVKSRAEKLDAAQKPAEPKGNQEANVPGAKAPSEESMIEAREGVRSDIKQGFENFRTEIEGQVAKGSMSRKDANAVLGAARAQRDDMLAKVSTKGDLSRDVMTARKTMEDANGMVQMDDSVMRANMYAQVLGGFTQAFLPVMNMFYGGMGIRETAEAVSKELQAGQRADSFNAKEFDALIASARDIVRSTIEMLSAIVNSNNQVMSTIAANYK